MDEMREREKRVTLTWDGLCGCDGFIEIDGGWVGRKAPVEQAGAKGGDRGGRMDWDGISLSPRPVRPPRCSTVAGAGADDRQTALSLGRRWGTLWNGQTALSKTGDTTTSVPPSFYTCHIAG